MGCSGTLEEEGGREGKGEQSEGGESSKHAPLPSITACDWIAMVKFWPIRADRKGEPLNCNNSWPQPNIR